MENEGIQLRDYQERIIEKAVKALDNGHSIFLIIAPPLLPIVYCSLIMSPLEIFPEFTFLLRNS